MNPFDERELTSLVKQRVGLKTTAEAKRALGATLGALRSAMAEEDARAAARDSPARLARVLERESPRVVFSARALYAEVARRERIELGFAMEQAQVVLQVLTTALDEDVVTRLRKHLPPDIAALLRPNRAVTEPPPYVHAHPERRRAPPQTLSRARPGAAEPIAETRHELAHAGSVVRSGAAHAETMVETARSTRPGREDETLASGRPRGRGFP